MRESGRKLIRQAGNELEMKLVLWSNILIN